jgi:hypothetical protein
MPENSMARIFTNFLATDETRIAEEQSKSKTKLEKQVKKFFVG